MKAKTLKVLKKSIKHWERLCRGEDLCFAGEYCALCASFQFDCFDTCIKNGEQCPVAKHVGVDDQSGCTYTPWMELFEHIHRKTDDTMPPCHADVLWCELDPCCPTCKRLAEKELKFLKSLLPKRKKK